MERKSSSDGLADMDLMVGFFLNWAGSQAGEGHEFHLLAIGLAAVKSINGVGAFSLDRVLFKKRIIQRTHMSYDW